MKKQYLILAALLSAHAIVQVAAAELNLPEPFGKLPDNLAPTFPRKAVDHVVTYASWNGWSPKDADHIVLFRHAAMVRTETTYVGSRRTRENEQVVDFSNIETTAALSLSLENNGSLSSVAIRRRGPENTPIYRHTIFATNESETIAGEYCLVWHAKPERSDGVPYTACITPDGIVLRETVVYGSDALMNEKRATKVERRDVQLGEVLPPVKALSWAFWATQTSNPAIDDSTDNYELRLTGKQKNVPISKIIRKAGGWYLEEDQIASTVQTLLISTPIATLSYSNHNDHRLTIAKGMVASARDPRALMSAPMERPSESVIGENCHWYDAALNVADYGREECRTPDQLPLIRNEYSQGGLRTSWTATELSRGKMTPENLAPPAWITDWALWGWPQLMTP